MLRHTFLLALALATLCLAEEGSLRSALNAINKRQHDLEDYPKYSDDFYADGDRYGYLADNSNDLAFLTPSEKNQDYKDVYEYEDNENVNKRISSAFRERIEEDKSRQKEKFENMLMNDLNDIRTSDENAEYLEFLHELWEKYGRSYPDILNYYAGRPKGEIRKRSHPHHYTGLGLDSVGMKKRSYKPSEANEYLYLVNYPKGAQSNYEVAKRFPVTKRSTYYPIPYTNEFSRHVKRSSKKEAPTKTDPKVAQDLSSIFSPKPKSEVPEKPVSKPKKTEHAVEETKKPEATTAPSTTTKRPEKEISTDAAKEKPIQLKKKSIDWSDYFGIDRRKKSGNLDNEWLMERYHKAVAMATKRDSETVQDKSKSRKSTEEKINEMDTKLKNIEYAIVDDALKFTGSHEGAVDSQEIQEVKDRLISQLAAAYSLEKMRRALGEYRKTIQEKKLRAKEGKEEEKLDEKVDEKRLSVPRKSAELEKDEDEDEDNNIKCSQDDENCNKETYGEIVDGPAFGGIGYCPKIQRVCADFVGNIGAHAAVLESACAAHQMCLLCGDNTWFTPTRHCNVMFLNKADYLCRDMECREIARRSVRYLVEMNRALKSEPMDTCDLTC